MKIDKVSDLSRVIKRIIEPDSINRGFGRVDTEKTVYNLPLEIEFCKGMEFDMFKITIEKVEKDYYIDKNGTKWVRSNE